MTPDAQLKRNRLQRFEPRAWIGYLVGYDSTNIFRIWIPRLNKVIRTRDVTFNEDEVFDGNTESEAIKENIRNISLERLTELLKELELPSEDEQPESVNEDEGQIRTGTLDTLDEMTSPIPSSSDNPNELLDPQPNESEIIRAQEALKKLEQSIYPTPPESPGAMLAGAISGPEGAEQKLRWHTIFATWQAAFMGGVWHNAKRIQKERRYRRPSKKSKVNRTFDQRRTIRMLNQSNQSNQKINKNHKIGVKNLQQDLPRTNLHQRDLPREPRWHEDLQTHLLGSKFLQAEQDHLKSHHDMESWSEVEMKSLGTTQMRQILDCMWVYVYKLNRRGELLNCKARLVVRGDQQSLATIGETYAATLAARSFRILIAIAAYFDLELKQYDAVNAFVHAPLDEEVFMRMPPGYRRPGRILKLNRALYGLRRSPYLWQQHLSTTLKELGFQIISHEPCCAIKDGILVFFYVDDIVFAYRKKDEKIIESIVQELKSKYKLTGGDNLKWFLGIEVIRDRSKKLIWLSQSSYIDKIADMLDSNARNINFQTPMTQDELLPYNGQASHAETNKYQRIIGSLMYLAVMTRPDIAFAVSRLSRFLVNPGPEHHKAAIRVIIYLKTYRNLGLQLGHDKHFEIASDASFADNTIDRKSSQAYAMKLFGGLIGWRANKQDTVTTSTTEAELLALSQAAKEGQYIYRLLKELSVRLDDQWIRIQCDNKQTIRLVTNEVTKLQTKLRHVDIHNHWLRQEVSRGHISVEYTKSSDMMADGLTKALSTNQHRVFIEQIGLIDIREHLKEEN